MAEDVKADELTETLRTSFAESIRDAIADLPPHLALQLADTLCSVQLDVLAGLRVRYKARTEVDSLAITEDWRKGLSLGEITDKYQVSRTTAYKHHPNRNVRHAKSG
jgi:hypothetical protein